MLPAAPVQLKQRFANEGGSVKFSGCESKDYCAPLRNWHAFQPLRVSGLNTWRDISDSSQAGIFVVVAVGFFILQRANDKTGCEWWSCSPRHHPFVSFRISAYWT